MLGRLLPLQSLSLTVCWWRILVIRGLLFPGVARPLLSLEIRNQTKQMRGSEEDAGGFVMWAGTWRVGGVLAASRAFGDRLLKHYVVADPEIGVEKVDDTLEFLIIASDGLWDVLTNEEAVSMTKPIQEHEEAAKWLMQEAYQRGSADDITIIVDRFLANQTKPSNSNSS